MWEQLKIFFAMGGYWAREAWSFAPCRRFWVASLSAAIVMVALVALLVFAARRWRIYAMRRASKRLTLEYIEMQQRVADESTMQRLRWSGDSIFAPEKDQALIAAEIRDALRSRKING